MLEVISTALVMGWSASFYCLCSCVPVLSPYTGTVAKPSFFSGLSLAALFSLGRLIAYVGLLSAFLILRQFVGVSTIFVTIAMLISGLLLLLSALVIFGVFKKLASLERILCVYVAGNRSPLYLGILTGIRPCGPLLAAIAFVLTLPGITKMGAFIVFFWLASSITLFSLAGISGGIAAFIGKRVGIDRIRRIAAIAMAVIGVALVLQAVGSLSQ
jgi:sulfite exporter TauE/SafE